MLRHEECEAKLTRTLTLNKRGEMICRDSPTLGTSRKLRLLLNQK